MPAAIHLLHLNPDHPQAIKELDDPYQIHRTLNRTLWNERMSNDRRAERIERARILFRTEPDQLRLWIVGQLEPNFARLPDGYFIGKPLSWNLDSFPQPGDELYFRVKSRPQRREGEKAFYLKGKEEIRDWLADIADAKGFEVLEAAWTPFEWIDTKDGQFANRTSFDLYGRLKVLNGVLFAKAMLDGIGREKAVGHGLLLVSRLVPWGHPDLVALRERPNIPLSQVRSRIERERNPR